MKSVTVNMSDELFEQLEETVFCRSLKSPITLNDLIIESLELNHMPKDLGDGTGEPKKHLIRQRGEGDPL